jgi:hypothetical protein
MVIKHSKRLNNIKHNLTKKIREEKQMTCNTYNRVIDYKNKKIKRQNEWQEKLLSKESKRNTYVLAAATIDFEGNKEKRNY